MVQPSLTILLQRASSDTSTQSALQSWLSSNNPRISLDAAGLVALADLSTVARRTELTGTSSILDTLVLCPGLYKQQDAPELNNGEYPACAAMTSGFVFRVENPATVLFLQKVGRTGCLTTLKVTGSPQSVVTTIENEKDRKAAGESGGISTLCSLTRSCLHYLYDLRGASIPSPFAYLLAISMTITVLLLCILLDDWWAVATLSMLILARLLNVLIVRRRAGEGGWKGALEPGAKGDLLILLSQDRWIRLRGAVDDLKAVTSGQWLREPSFAESALVAFERCWSIWTRHWLGTQIRRARS